MVYVDNARIRYGRMLMSHLVADSEAELHAFAAQLGLRREWFQSHGRHAHYDVSQTLRARALAAGAQSVSSREIVLILEEQRRAQAL